MRGNEFLNKLENIDPAYIEAAGQATKKKKSPWVRWASIAACFAILVASTIGVVTHLGNNPQTSVPENLDHIIWGKNVAGGDMPQIEQVEKTYTWKQKNVTKELYDALNEAGNDDWFALGISVKNAEDSESYIYEGKTLSTWRNEYEQTQREITLLQELYKDIIYSAEAKETAQQLFERQKDHYGEEFLNRFYVDGAFDLSKIEDAVRYAEESEKQIDKALSDGRECFVKEKQKEGFEKLSGKGCNVVLKNNHYFLFITKSDFAAMKAGDFSNYVFVQASRKAFDEVTIPVITVPVSEIALEKFYVYGETGYVRPKTNEELTEAVRKSVEKYFYTYDCIQVKVKTEKGSPMPDFGAIDCTNIETLIIKYLPYDSYTLNIPFDSIHMESIGALSNNENVIEIIIEFNFLIQPDNCDME